MSATLYRRWFDEVWNRGRTSTIDELLAPAARLHGLSETPGPAGFHAFYRAFVQGFPSVRVEVHDVVESAPGVDGVMTVAGRFTARVVTDAGISVEMPCMSFTRWRRGQMVEAWDVADFRGLEKAVGSLPF